jgi:hypothetical protein
MGYISNGGGPFNGGGNRPQGGRPPRGGVIVLQEVAITAF